MGQFIGRQKELALLERIYEKETVKTCIVYGRRRIGKTRLLKEFSKGRRTLFVQFVESSEQANAEILTDAVNDLIGSDIHSDDLRHALKNVVTVCSQEKTLVVFDEVPHLLKGNQTVASELQHMIDTIRNDTESMVVFCGSSISLMMEEVMDKKKPLYGRFAFRLEVGPMDLKDVRRFHPSASDTDLLKIYLTLGGVTAYHELVGDSDYTTVVNEYVLNANSIIRSDIPYDIRQELGHSADDAFAVLESISSGYDIYKQIVGRTGLNDNRLSDCLRRLTEIRVIKKMESVPVARKSNHYVITDRLTSFHFAMQRYTGLIQDEKDVYDILKPIITSHLGHEFEGFCRDYTTKNYPCIEVGSWWGPTPTRDEYGNIVKDASGKPVTEDVDIDVTATIMNEQNRIHLFGECKLTGKVMGFSALNTLQERVDSLRGHYNERLALFSASGFDEGLSEYAEDNGIMLFDLDTLVGKRACPEMR